MIDDAVLLNDWHPLLRGDALTDGAVRAARLLGTDVVLWRSGGRVHAWRDLCLHRGAKLSLGAINNGRLACAYHGWEYDGAGACVHMPAHPDQTPPAKAHAPVYHVRERYGLIWVCMGEPSAGAPDFPEWDQSGFVGAVCGPFRGIRATGPRLIENYLDAAHFPFVHEGVLGDRKFPELGEFQARITANGVESDPIAVYQPDPFAGPPGRVTYTYHAFRPLTAHFTKHMPGAVNGMMLTVTPVDILDCTGWFIVATNGRSGYDSARLEAEYTPRIAAIFEEDRAVVESQRPELLPLDLQAELHLKSDRVAIAYRLWLRQLGVRWGVAGS
jgi:phenylpropionate dioxygenase-like ring-hydroxylating dioxygenase large terminal subunit